MYSLGKICITILKNPHHITVTGIPLIFVFTDKIYKRKSNVVYLNKAFFDTMQEYEHIRQEFNDCYMSLESYEGWEKDAIKKAKSISLIKKRKLI